MKSPSFSYLQNRILCGPNEVLFPLLIFILSKNIHATALQLTLMACFKPITSLFSYYISTTLHNRTHLIRPYLILNTLAGMLPCFLYPFVDNVWYYIGSYVIYMITNRAQEPAWIEYLKGHLELPKMSKTVAKGTSITYLVGMLLPPLLSFWLDDQLWKVLFVIFASLQLLNLINIISLKPKLYENKLDVIKLPPLQQIIDPLKKGWELLKNNPSFSHYLFLYFLGGAGIIAIQPVLPKYFNENLGLSYTQLTLAFSFCKGISFLASSPIWAKYATRLSLYRINAYMNILTCLFISGLLAASFGTEWLYAGYLCYGVMQGGCQLTWNLSGPSFSRKGDSAPYSSLNLILVGIRGCICPFLGTLLFTYAGATALFLSAFSICFIGILYGIWLDVKYPAHEQKVRIV